MPSGLIAPDNLSCLHTPAEVSDRVLLFLKNTSGLPSVSVTEIAYHSDFTDLFFALTPERRRWMELAQILAVTGWRCQRGRSLYYKGPDDYINRSGSRWFPPAAPAASPTDS